MSRLWNLNLWLYHSVEILLCDVKILFFKGRLKYHSYRIARLKAKLKKMPD